MHCNARSQLLKKCARNFQGCYKFKTFIKTFDKLHNHSCQKVLSQKFYHNKVYLLMGLTLHGACLSLLHLKYGNLTLIML